QRIGYSTVVADNAPAPLFEAGKTRPGRIAARGASYYQIRQTNLSGDSVAIHSLARGPGALAAVEILVAEAQHCVVAHYRFPGPQRGASLTVGEHKLITGGGFYDRIADYIAFMNTAGAPKSADQ